jgi:hypothetical protein
LGIFFLLFFQAMHLHSLFFRLERFQPWYIN